MKKTIILLFLVLSMSVASAQDTLTPAQMREDFNFMMEQYEHIHPNPTWSLGEESYSELKQQTLAQLDHPMTQLDFWRIIARWNHPQLSVKESIRGMILYSLPGRSTRLHAVNE